MTNNDKIDPERPRGRPFDREEGSFGQGYVRAEEEKLGAADPSGQVAGTPPRDIARDSATPPDNGQRANVDPATGEVRGSGASAGGGNAGEDPDDDSAAGDGPVTTGAAPAKPAD